MEHDTCTTTITEPCDFSCVGGPQIVVSRLPSNNLISTKFKISMCVCTCVSCKLLAFFHDSQLHFLDLRLIKIKKSQRVPAKSKSSYMYMYTCAPTGY